MRRMAVLVGQAMKFGEPVLLVGETGYHDFTVIKHSLKLPLGLFFAPNEFALCGWNPDFCSHFHEVLD